MKGRNMGIVIAWFISLSILLGAWSINNDSYLGLSIFGAIIVTAAGYVLGLVYEVDSKEGKNDE